MFINLITVFLIFSNWIVLMFQVFSLFFLRFSATDGVSVYFVVLLEGVLAQRDFSLPCFVYLWTSL